MSWPNGTFPPTEASVFFNSNGRHLQHGQVSNINTASVVSLNLTFTPPPTEAPVLSNMNGSHLHHGQDITPIIEQNNLNQENEMVNPNVENSTRSKRRKLKSKVWDEFTKHEGEDGKEWAKCNHCRKKFVGSSKSGTTHLKNHLERCPSKRNPGGVADKSMAISGCLTTSVVMKKKSMVGEESNHLDETRMIIKYWIPSLNSIKDDILDVYQEEKEKLRRYFNKLTCRFSLSIHVGFHFWFMILYFIDDSWELKKRIIHLEKEESEEGVLESVKSLLVDLSIDKNIIFIVDDGGDEEEWTEMNTWFRERGLDPFLGICAPLSHCLNQFDSEMYFTIEDYNILPKVTKLPAYVKMTSSNANRFRIAVDKAKSMGKKVTSQGVPDDGIRGFTLLEWVIGFKEAFSELEHIDPDFKSRNLKKEDWDCVTSLYECWKVVKDAIRSLSDCKYKTANVYFPIVCDIFLKLVQWERSVHQFGHKTTSCPRQIFDEYWNNVNLILTISVILDPRFKMEIVERWYKEIYGDDADMHLDKIIAAVTNIYNEYAKGINNFKSSSSWNHDDTNSSTPFEMLDGMGRPCTSPQHVNLLQSELDCYLKDFKCDRVKEFDILAWWRVNSLTYPTLARMAREFLAIPFHNFHNNVNPSFIGQLGDIFEDVNLDDNIKQALICTKVWLYNLENK